MSKKHENPYKENGKGKGIYHRVFEKWRKTGIAGITRKALIASEVAEGRTESQASADVTVVLGPTKESTRGDCRGNLSAQGHLYFARRVPIKGQKREMRYILQWRSEPLEPQKRVKAIDPDAPAKKRGRPRKVVEVDPNAPVPVAKKRGRPRKVVEVAPTAEVPTVPTVEAETTEVPAVIENA